MIEDYRCEARECNDHASPEAVVSTNNKGPRLWGLHTCLSLVLALGLVVTMAFMVDLKAVWRELMACNKALVLLALLAHYATFPIRGMRWRRALNHLHTGVSSWRFGLLIYFYFFVDNLVPAKLGELYGAHLVRINLGISRSAALGSLVFLRMADAWSILSLAALSSWAIFSYDLDPTVFWTLIFGLLLAVLLTLALVTFFLLRGSLPTWTPTIARQMINAFQSGMWPRRGERLAIVALTGAVWALEVLWTLLLLRAFGLSLSGMEVVFLTMIPALASASPLTPAGAGVFELTLYGCLRALDIASPTAASVTVLHRCIDYWLHIGTGVLTWLARRSIGLRTWGEAHMAAHSEPDG